MEEGDPFVPIPQDVIPVMLRLASLRPGETLVDMGSGDGRILFVAAEEFGARAVGVEADPELARKSRAKARELGLAGRVVVHNKRFRSVSLRSTDVVAMYLSSYAMGLVAKKMAKELRGGARVVTFDFEIFGWTPSRVVQFTPKGWKKEHPTYLYPIEKPAE